MAKLSNRITRIIDILQWVMILLSIAACIYIYKKNNIVSSQDVIEKQNNRYIRIYDSQKISYLEKQNKELYDSINKLKNAESAIQIKYVYKYKTDTIHVSSDEISSDSIYKYCYDNDTVKYDITIKANDIKWHTSSFQLHNEFTIININDKDKNTAIIDTDPNTEITDITTWRKKQNFKDKIFYGPSINIGYGIINKKPDFFIGISVGYNLNQ